MGKQAPFVIEPFLAQDHQDDCRCAKCRQAQPASGWAQEFLPTMELETANGRNHQANCHCAGCQQAKLATTHFAVEPFASSSPAAESDLVGVDALADEQAAEWFEFAPLALEVPASQPVLRRGAKGSAVVDLQKRLATFGFSSGTADGVFGSLTEVAVKNFQRARGLGADGIVGAQTWGAILTPTAPKPPVPGGSPGEPQVTIASGVLISANAVRVLKDILRAAGLTRATVTSGRRTSNDQSRIMYDLIERNGVAYAKNLYGSTGDKVIDVYAAAKAAGKSATEIKLAMERKIKDLGCHNVSHHCSDEYDVFDVAPSSISNAAAFRQALDAAVSSGVIDRYIPPPDDPAFHIEITLTPSALEIMSEIRQVRRFRQQEVEYEEQELDASQGKTLYLPVKLNNTVPPKVSVFIPSSFQPTAAIDLIVYFHGHIISDCKTDPSEFRRKGMAYYWNTPFFKCLREDLVASGKKAILLAPTFIPIFATKNNSPRDYGDLNKAGKFDFLVTETLAQLKKSGELPPDAQVRNIILSGHSGGGLPMQTILSTKNSLTRNVSECWGFECLYFGTSIWEKWLAENQHSTFRHFRREAKFVTGTDTLKKYTNFVDIKDGTDHCRIVQEKWRQAIDSSRVFQGGRKSPTSSATNRSLDEKFSLVEWKLATKKIVVARARDKKTGMVIPIMEAPAVFLPKIISMARDMAIKDGKNVLADKLDPATWFKKFTRITFLGRPLKSGQYLHIEMAKHLKAIEAKMVEKYGGNAQSVGDMLLNKSTEGISGSRLVSSTATFSMHMFGLAVDVNYLGNPFIQSRNDVNALNSVLKNAALLLNKPPLSYKPGKKNKFGSVQQLFDRVQQLDAMLEKYFNLLDAPAELQRLVQASFSSEWRGLSVADATIKIQKNLEKLAGYLARGGDKTDYFKKHGILDFDKRFVVQMEELGLSWGGRYGDMMHFDLRKSGVGIYIKKARSAYAKRVNG